MEFTNQYPLTKPAWLIVIAFILCFSSIHAQERCGIIPYTKHLMRKDPTPNNHDERFEKWVKQKLEARNRNANKRGQTVTYQIPVVVHIIHNGEPVGTGTNLSEDQVLSQMVVLNNDFKRFNADAANTPIEFQSVAAGFNIEFILAKQDPEGLPTTGIARVQGTQTSWTIDDEDTFKGLSYWPAEDYYNVWVCNLTDFLGYTQLPYSSYPGLAGQSLDNPLTDGVVVNYESFGSIDLGAFKLKSRYDKGRTLTHETGHFFGLRHIWGDDGGACGGDGDYVDDTPDQGDSTGGGSCSNPKISCGVHKMFQNYMDYSNDACMNIFTEGQVSRMETIIENSTTRRTSLLTSHGLDEPAPVPNDLKISQTISPRKSICDCTIAPAIEVTNKGTNKIFSARILLEIDSIFSEVKDFTLNLDTTKTTTLYFSPYKLNIGVANFTFTILRTNDGIDGNVRNNKAKIKTTVTHPYFVYYDLNGGYDFYLKFNFSESQTVGLDIIDTMGKLITNVTLADVLDKTYPLNLPVECTSGVYIVRLRASQVNDAERILIRR